MVRHDKLRIQLRPCVDGVIRAEGGVATLWAWRALHPMACSTPFSSALLYRAASGSAGCGGGPCAPPAPAPAVASAGQGPAAASEAAAWGSSAGPTPSRGLGGAAPPSGKAAGGRHPGSEAPRFLPASAGSGQSASRSCLADPASPAVGSCSTRSTATACKHVPPNWTSHSTSSGKAA